MWDQIQEYPHESHGVRAVSWRSVGSKIPGHFDIAIFFGSHESRALVSSKLLRKRSCGRTIVVFFDEKDGLGLREKYDRELLSQVKVCSRQEPTIVDCKKRDIEGTLHRIFAEIPPADLDNAKNWFVDIVGAPKPHYLCLLGHLRRFVKSPRLTLFHPSGDYEKVTPTEEAWSFTAGLDRYMWVPYYWGRPDPVLPYTYMFLLGFEGYRSYEIYDKFEPRYVKALISDPGYTEQYVRIAKERNCLFIQQANPEILYADAGDPVETWKALEDCIHRDSNVTNICIVPLGPKPHALGGGLLALAEGTAGILYLMPRTYKFKDTHRGKYIWRYEIEL